MKIKTNKQNKKKREGNRKKEKKFLKETKVL